MKTTFALLILSSTLTACVSQAGLKAQAASDMSCDEEKLSTKKVKSGYSGDDFGARFEVAGCGEKVVYEKKGEESWAAVTEAEDIE